MRRGGGREGGREGDKEGTVNCSLYHPPVPPTEHANFSALFSLPPLAVLDDNCTLCLPNGERIKLNATTMRMLFEVQDLAVASPATVSRCGMVYVPAEDLGWRPVVRSWLAGLKRAHHTLPGGGPSQHAPPGSLNKEGSAALLDAAGAAGGEGAAGYSEEVVGFLLGLFERFVEPLLRHVRRHCHELVPSVDVNLVTSTAKIFEVGAWGLHKWGLSSHGECNFA